MVLWGLKKEDCAPSPVPKQTTTFSAELAVIGKNAFILYAYMHIRLCKSPDGVCFWGQNADMAPG